MDVLSVCPLLAPQDVARTVYDGFIAVKGEDFRVHIELPPDRRVRKAHISCEWRLQHLLRAHNKILQQRLQQSSTLSSFLVELKSLIERELSGEHKTHLPPPVQYYDVLLRDIEALGWHRLVYIDSEFKTLHLEAKDVSSRCHTLKVTLQTEHPSVAPKCVADFPLAFDFVWSQKVNTLCELFSQFEGQLSRYQELWDMLDEIDGNTWVLEPEKPTRSATFRRIAVGSNASLQIDINPAHPREFPDCKFLGADHVVNPLKQALNENLKNWDPQQSILTNLKSVLEVDFPSPATSSKEEFSVECGICYSYRLDTHIPDQVCDDARCNQPFHQACLYEWLRALASSRQSFNTVFGECPYCSKPITVKMPTK